MRFPVITEMSIVSLDIIGMVIAALLLFLSTLELWFAPNNDSLFKDSEKKLMIIIIPMLLVSFAI